jgi:CRISPR-associated protein Cas2
MTQKMLFVIAYDVPNDKRRTKVHKVLSGFGKWTQYSLFECFLTERELVSLRARLYDVIQITDDSVRIYPLCNACVGQVETIGGDAPSDPIAFVY